jgi:crotonobetainyl-CoA:carnitine CoA-transferase CaiB-like acyl-CoA transferase
MPQTALTAELAAFFAGIPLADCEARFAATDCCLSAVLDLAEAVASPHHAGRGVLRRTPTDGLQALFPALVDGEPMTARPPLSACEEITNSTAGYSPCHDRRRPATRDFAARNKSKRGWPGQARP